MFCQNALHFDIAQNSHQHFFQKNVYLYSCMIGPHILHTNSEMSNGLMCMSFLFWINDCFFNVCFYEEKCTKRDSYVIVLFHLFLPNGVFHCSIYFLVSALTYCISIHLGLKDLFSSSWEYTAYFMKCSWKINYIHISLVNIPNRHIKTFWTYIITALFEWQVFCNPLPMLQFCILHVEFLLLYVVYFLKQ